MPMCAPTRDLDVGVGRRPTPGPGRRCARPGRRCTRSRARPRSGAPRATRHRSRASATSGRASETKAGSTKPSGGRRRGGRVVREPPRPRPSASRRAALARSALASGSVEPRPTTTTASDGPSGQGRRPPRTGLADPVLDGRRARAGCTPELPRVGEGRRRGGAAGPARGPRARRPSDGRRPAAGAAPRPPGVAPSSTSRSIASSRPGSMNSMKPASTGNGGRALARASANRASSSAPSARAGAVPDEEQRGRDPGCARRPGPRPAGPGRSTSRPPPRLRPGRPAAPSPARRCARSARAAPPWTRRRRRSRRGCRSTRAGCERAGLDRAGSPRPARSGRSRPR